MRKKKILNFREELKHENKPCIATPRYRGLSPYVGQLSRKRDSGSEKPLCKCLLACRAV